ncbi:MAG: sugar nucleotide-binding protein [Nitrosomonadales bacterium]
MAIVDDQIGAPTWSREIARATAQIMGLYLQRTVQKQISGIYNLTAQGQTSWFGFARAAAECGLFAGLDRPADLARHLQQGISYSRKASNEFGAVERQTAGSNSIFNCRTGNFPCGNVWKRNRAGSACLEQHGVL